MLHFGKMESSRIFYFIFAAALSVCALGSPSPKYITGPPLNLAAVYGDTSATLTCATDRPGGQVNWFVVYVGQAMMTTVVQGCSLNPGLVNSYVLRDPVDMTPCDLGVISVDRPLAGAYTCQESAGFDPPFSAQFVVLDSDPACRILVVDETDIVAGDLVQFACDVNYTNNLSPVFVSWQQEDDTGANQDVNSTDVIANGRTFSRIDIVAAAPSILPVHALSYFAAPVSPPTSATNTPLYTYEWTTPEIRIKYCPYNISVTELPEPLAGDVITCSANGNPDPTYTWFNLITGESINGPDLTIAAPGDFIFQCRATNVIRGSACYVEITINGTALEPMRPPRNAATVFGTNETMVCKFGHTPLNWVFTAPGGPGLAIVQSCEVTPPALPYYSVDPSNGGCDLIVMDVRDGRAGTYTCQEVQIFHRPATAMLVVLESDPVCWSNVTGDYVVNGDRIKFTCSLNYTGELTPFMTWTTSSLDPIGNATNTNTSTLVESSITMPVFPKFIQSFTSRTFFNAPRPPPPGFYDPATNPPDYEYIWSSRVLTVMYCPTNVTITSSRVSEDYFIGQTLTCSAEGFPEPEYVWTNLLTNGTTYGPIVNITTSGLSVVSCRAYNVIQGTSCSDSAFLSAFVYGYSRPGNTAIVAGGEVRLTCRMSNQRVSWLFTPAGTTSPMSIVSDCDVLMSQIGTYTTDRSNASCDLIIPNVQLDRAGTYTCQDPFTLDQPKSALLIVLETEPVGELLVAEDDCQARMACTVRYRGLLAPQMFWTNEVGDDLANATTTTTTAEEVTSYIDIPLLPDAGLPRHTCLTYFNAPEPQPPSQIDPATNRPEYTHQWTSPAVIIDEQEVCPVLVQKNDMVGVNMSFFHRTWQAFRDGFSDGRARFWIGLDRLHALTVGDNCTLHIDLQALNGSWFWAEYDHFEVANSANNFQLSVGGYSGDSGDLLAYHDGTRFATYDFDFNGCALRSGGGFWYRNCYEAGINCSPDYNFYWFPNAINPAIHLNQTTLWLLC